MATPLQADAVEQRSGQRGGAQDAPLAQEQHLRQVAETLQQLALELNADLDEGRILARTLELAARVVPSDSARVWIVEGDRARIAAAVGPGRGSERVGDSMPLGQLPAVQQVVATGSALCIAHLQADPRYVAGAYEGAPPRSYLAAPLLAGGECIGSVSLSRKGLGSLSEEDERALAAFAAQAGLAVYNARLLAKAARRAQEEAAVARAAAAIATGSSLEEACRALLVEIRLLLPSDRASIVLRRPGGELVRAAGLFGPDNRALPSGVPPLARAALAEALDTGRTVVSHDVVLEVATDISRAEEFAWTVVVPLLPLPPGDAAYPQRPVGTINVASREPVRYGPAEVALLERVAARLAGALEAAGLREERDRASGRVALLLRLAVVLSRSLDLRHVFREFSGVLRSAVTFDRLSVMIRESGSTTLRRYAVIGGEDDWPSEGTGFNPEGTVAGYVSSTQRPLVRLDLARQRSFLQDDALLELGVRSDAVLPLVAGADCLGVLVLASRTAGTFSPTDLELLQPVAEHLALAVDRSLAHQRILQQALRVQTINRVARLLSRGLNLQSTFAAFAAELRSIMPHDRTALANLRPGATHVDLMTSAATGAEDLTTGAPATIPLAGGPLAWVIEHRQILLRRDLAAEATFPAEQEALALGIRSHVLLPLLVGDRALGALVLSSRQPNAFEPAHLLLLQPLADQLATALENALLHEAVYQQAITDPLTGLFNRRYFDERLEPEIERCRRLGYPLGLLFADLDSLKEINDVLGHPAGDAALRLTAASLQASLRMTDLLTRWGGDEFVMLLPGQSVDGLRTVSEKLRVALAGQPPFVSQAARTITLSLGGAVYPADAESAEALVAAADRALFAAKDRGGNCCLMAADLRSGPPAGDTPEP